VALTAAQRFSRQWTCRRWNSFVLAIVESDIRKIDEIPLGRLIQ